MFDTLLAHAWYIVWIIFGTTINYANKYNTLPSLCPPLSLFGRKRPFLDVWDPGGPGGPLGGPENPHDPRR